MLAVDYPDFEVIVVDNASSTDATEQVVAELGDPRVCYVTSSWIADPAAPRSP